jgi:hypothetical protein
VASYIIALAWVVCALRGFVQYLIIRSQLKARIMLERERNRAYLDYVNRLPRAAELLDYEDQQGRSLWIRKDGAPGWSAGSAGSASAAMGPFSAENGVHTVDYSQVKLAS